MEYFNKIVNNIKSVTSVIIEKIDSSIGKSLRIKLVETFSPLLLFFIIFLFSIYNLTSIIFYYALTKTLVLSHYLENYKKNDKSYNISNDWLIYAFSLIINNMSFLFFGFLGYILKFLSILFIFDLLFLKVNNDKYKTMNTFLYDSLTAILDNHYLYKNKYVINVSDFIYKLETQYYPSFRFNVFEKFLSIYNLILNDNDNNDENKHKEE